MPPQDGGGGSEGVVVERSCNQLPSMAPNDGPFATFLAPLFTVAGMRCVCVAAVAEADAATMYDPASPVAGGSDGAFTRTLVTR